MAAVYASETDALMPSKPGKPNETWPLKLSSIGFPSRSSSGPLLDLDGNVIADSFNGHVSPGFPGFDGMSASVSLAYTAAMQEHGVAVTYSYISSAHVDANGNDAGPGQADYVARLHAYDQEIGRAHV